MNKLEGTMVQDYFKMFCKKGKISIKVCMFIVTSLVGIVISLRMYLNEKFQLSRTYKDWDKEF